MNLSEEVRSLSKELNISFSEIARRTGQSPANLSKKLKKETLSFDDFEKILESLGVRMEYSFILPGQSVVGKAFADKRTESRLAILEKELELERMKNEYYKSSEFAFRTAMETISGSIDIISNHADDPKRVKSSADRMRIASGQLLNIIGDDKSGTQTENLSGLSGVALAGKRVLVVDDNAINRDIVIDLLADSGLEGDEASDGAEALDKIKAFPEDYYAIVLMDLQMPGMDGFETSRSIRSLQGGRANIPIIAMTAGYSEDDREKAAVSGMNGFVLKPLNLQKLLDIFTER